MSEMSSMELAKKHFGGDKSSEFKKAKPSGGGDWQKPGHYYQILRAVKMQRTRKGDEGFMVESTVIHVFDDVDGTGHRVGADATHAMWTKHDSFYGNVKEFVCAVLGCSQEEANTDQVFEVLAEDQPLADMVIEVKAREITTRAGNPFTKVGYEREVSAQDLASTLSDEAKRLYVPDLDLRLKQAQPKAEGAA